MPSTRLGACLPAGRAELVDLPAGRQARWSKVLCMFYVYALSGIEKNYIYVGLTSDLERRMQQHNSGKEKTTRNYRPFQLIYSEIYTSRLEARGREKYWKWG
ncbi:GIY-YIG nuclease family protein [Salinimicrobium xinjiangense]|uniref:GIY-YIG nuclease family protein n=1 Tax=Salinimicrobium xinjiangense TaxID=438596 RepID=UPI0004295E86|nr:GIY-YIG nuclease family protein [Salinimicrobium xinjiangense]